MVIHTGTAPNRTILLRFLALDYFGTVYVRIPAKQMNRKLACQCSEPSAESLASFSMIEERANYGKLTVKLCARASELREAQAESRSTVSSCDGKLAVVRSPFDNVKLTLAVRRV